MLFGARGSRGLPSICRAYRWVDRRPEVSPILPLRHFRNGAGARTATTTTSASAFSILPACVDRPRTVTTRNRAHSLRLLYVGPPTSKSPRPLLRRSFSSSDLPPGPPPLFDAVLRRDHKATLKRAKSHPREASYRHPRGWTALHCCVESSAPMEVVRELVRACPEALHVTDWKGRTPAQVALHDETREWLEKKALGEVDECESRTDRGESSEGNNVSGQHNLRRLLPHAEKLSEDLASLESTCRSLRREIEELRASLGGIDDKTAEQHTGDSTTVPPNS